MSSSPPRRSTMADHLDRLPGSGHGLVRPVAVSVLTNPLVRAVAEAFEDTNSTVATAAAPHRSGKNEVNMDDEEDGGVGDDDDDDD